MAKVNTKNNTKNKTDLLLEAGIEVLNSEKSLTPGKIVKELDKYIVGQEQAKKIVAIALRNRLRRSLLPEEIKEEIIPKNILMIGPTGVGKTEIARRLSNLVSAPFIKVEATKYTEVGYIGRDVESMIRDLVEISIRMIQKKQKVTVEEKAKKNAIETLLDILQPMPSKKQNKKNADTNDEIESVTRQLELTQVERLRERLMKQLLSGEIDDYIVEIDVSDSGPKMIEIFTSSGIEEMGINIQDMLGQMMPKRKKKKKVSVAEAKEILTNQEIEKLVDMDFVVSQAIQLVEQSGIVFVDEIDKIAGREQGRGPDVSREGVQRDILPIVEGSTVLTKYGPVKTNHILFIAAGAFHVSKPSDLIPELQGRFPLRVELDSLSKEDFKRILTEPKNALTKQYVALLGADGVTVEFTKDSIDEIAETACLVNEQTENIGARRLHTIMEKILEDISFAAPDNCEQSVIVDSQFVKNKLKDIVKDVDLSRYIL